MKVIGVTGGVGAGKSTVLNFLEETYGACVIEADKVGHLVMMPGEQAYEAIVHAFGTEILAGSKEIDRGILGRIVFADKEKLELLNSIVHPAVKEWIVKEMKRQEDAGCKLLVVEAALLIEDHYDAICHEMWYIYTDAQVRRARLKASRGYSDEKIDSIFRNQLSEAEFRAACQVVIDNSGASEETRRQIKVILEGETGI